MSRSRSVANKGVVEPLNLKGQQKISLFARIVMEMKKVAMGNGVGLRISHIGSNNAQTPFVPFRLNNMLYIPNTSTNHTVLRMIIIAFLYLTPLVFVSRTRLLGRHFSAGRVKTLSICSQFVGLHLILITFCLCW